MDVHVAHIRLIAVIAIPVAVLLLVASVVLSPWLSHQVGPLVWLARVMFTPLLIANLVGLRDGPMFWFVLIAAQYAMVFLFLGAGALAILFLKRRH